MDAAVGQAIQGGRYLARAAALNRNVASRTQDLDASGNAAAIDRGELHAHLHASLGGRSGDSNYGELSLDFRDGSDNPLPGVPTLRSATTEAQFRNDETQMLSRRVATPVPVGARSARIRIGMLYRGGTAPSVDVFADNVGFVLSRDAGTPDPFPLDTELLDHPGFEGPRVSVSRPRFGDGWINADSPFQQVDYGTPGFPSLRVGADVGGGRAFVRSTAIGGTSRLLETLDLTRNATEVDTGLLALHLAGWFGGLGSDPDLARLTATCRNQKGQILPGGSFSVGDVSFLQRNNQSTLLPREGVFRIPAATRSILLELTMENRSNDGSIAALADNLSVQLTRGLACGSPQCITLSSSAPASAKAVTGTLAAQLNVLNANPPAFSPSTWTQVYRKNENANPALNRSFNCNDPRIIPLNEAFGDAVSYLQDAGEVTLDNCSSAFYRFTFGLPAAFQNATLYGVANVDDQARIFLNGNPITGEMLADSFGSDTLDANGTRVMTWPTRDAFSTNDVSLFRGGTNELVFAVCSDASQFEPAGLEFEARVQVDTFAALTLDSHLLSTATGGVRNFFLDAGPGNGRRPYLIVGSFDGMWPGLSINGYTVPLNRDFYFDFLLGSPNAFILGSSGTLSTAG